MTGYLICEDGPLSEWIFTFEEDDTFAIGRDGDVCNFVIEDPMVSRKHLSITKEGETFFIQNESATNPALLNDEEIENKNPLNEGDLVQIGNNVFRFTTKAPQSDEEEAQKTQKTNTPKEEEATLTLGRFPSSTASETNWLIKVVNGASAGSSFALHKGESYVIGTDGETSDILLHDLSISKNHARITLSENGEASIVDLQSKNGVYVEGKKIENDRLLKPEDLIILGTTSLVFIDMNQTRETIYSPTAEISLHPEKSIFAGEEEEEKEENWKETFIPTKHLAIASVFSVFICVGIISMLSLFRSTTVEMPKIDETANIATALSHFQDIEFNYNKDTATLFLTGHVLTDVNYNELLYRLKTIPYIRKTDDNVVIDELVSENMNALILKNPRWNSILMISKEPGKYLLTGYIEAEKDKAELIDFVNKYFNYLNRLDNQVVVIDTLDTHIKTLLIENGFANVMMEQNMGQIVLAGRAHITQKEVYDQVLTEINNIHGVRSVQNFVIFTTQNTAAINITDKYKVTGSSKYGNNSQFVLIGGKILGVDDTLDGMTITKINDKEILLKKDGIKYTIDFNN
ncbi:type III secretion system inner membrane ring subunit SctD [bacterium]|nr:type III secretion system inner membrane ring subunit SctD [bacterium]